MRIAREGAWLGVAAIVLASCATAPLSCAPRSGGEEGAVGQLVSVGFGDDQVSLIFGLRDEPTYGVPRYEARREGGLIRLRLPNARLRYADGSPSYYGERVLRPPDGRIQRVRILEEGQGVVVELEGAPTECPRVASRRFGRGTVIGAALVSLAVRDGPAVALDSDGGPPRFPMQVVGVGFPPSADVRLRSAGRLLWESRTDERGDLDTVFYVPDVPPGRYQVVVSAPGASAAAWYRAEAR